MPRPPRLPRLGRYRHWSFGRRSGRRRGLSRTARARLLYLCGAGVIVVLAYMVAAELLSREGPAHRPATQLQPVPPVSRAGGAARRAEGVPEAPPVPAEWHVEPAPPPPPLDLAELLPLGGDDAARRPAPLVDGGMDGPTLPPAPGPSAPPSVAELVPVVPLASAARPEPERAARPPETPPPPRAAARTGPALASLAAPVARPPFAPAPASPGAPRRVTGKPALIAIIIDDLGPPRALTGRAIALAGPLTMAFLPYADDLAPQVARARRMGHEIFLHMPMQPMGEAWPGPDALTVGMGPSELRERLRRAIGRVEGATGVNNHMGSRLTADAGAMSAVMAELKRDGLLFVDSRTTGNTVAASVAAEQGLPHTARDVFLDHFPGRPFLEHQLLAVETLAQRTGSAVAIGHPYETTLAVLARWIPDAKARGFRFVTVSEVIRARGCAGNWPRGRGCGLVHDAAQRAGEDCGEERCAASLALGAGQERGGR